MTAITDAYEAFRATQERFADFGACDTEPRCVFVDLLVDVYDDKDVTLPRTAHDWQLFTGEGQRGNGLAAAAMTRAAAKVVQAAQADREELDRFMKYQGWC